MVRPRLPQQWADGSDAEGPTTFPPVVSWPAEVASELEAVFGGELEVGEAPADESGTRLTSPLRYRLELAIGAAEVQGRTACATLAAVAGQLSGVEPREAAALTEWVDAVTEELGRLRATMARLVRRRP
ncbi:hypothetical protein [Frankia sp. Cas3]|uniref:hypothetical protein n=1 Tax=Frankia sp. Cas3 TaxID=3073926 RepID=UPI002AD56ADC|nr:hypothetical protein [Frankia sp. Cas3]